MRAMNATARKAGLLGLTLALGLGTAPADLRAQQGAGEKAAQAQERSEAVPQEQPRQISVKVLGMSCPFCAYGVEQKLQRLEGVEELTVELKSGVATLTLEEGADISNEKLVQTVKQAGFEAVEITRNFESEHPDWKPERQARTP